MLSGIRLVHDVPYTGSRGVDGVGAVLSVLGMGGVVLGILVWQEGGEAVGALHRASAPWRWARWCWWLARRKREGKPTLIDPDLFRSKPFRLGITGQMLQQIALGGAMIALPIYLQMVLEYNAMEAGLSIAPLSLSMFAVALLAGRRAGDAAAERASSGAGFALLSVGAGAADPIVPRADSGWALVDPAARSPAAGWACSSPSSTTTRCRPISEERVSEAAGVNSAAGSFGLSFGLAFAGAIMLATLSIAFTDHGRGQHRAARRPSKQQVAEVLEDDAEVMSNTQLEELLAGAARRRSRRRSSASTPRRGRARSRSRC